MFEEERRIGIQQGTVKELLNVLIEYLDKTYSYNAKVEECVQTAKAIVALFPSLKVEPSDIDGIDKLYDFKARRGLLYNKVKNKGAKKIQKRQVRSEEVVFSEAEKEELIVFFKTAPCTKRSEIEDIKQKLSQTVEFRRELLQNGSTDVYQTFRFFYVSTDLVNTVLTYCIPTFYDSILFFFYRYCSILA